MSTSNVSDIFDSIKKSVMLRVFIIGFLVLILLAPTTMIEFLIHEREQRRDSVIREINSKWALDQTMTGPVLKVPYLVYIENPSYHAGGTQPRVITQKKMAYFLPDQLKITGNIKPETRYRGIYKSIVYTADLEIKGDFEFPDFAKLKLNDKPIVWDEAVLTFGIADMRGINKDIQLDWNAKKLNPKPGIPDKNLFSAGISANVPVDESDKKSYTFRMNLSLRGSQTISFLPFGRKTDVTLNSTWNSPSFQGAYLPKKRVMDERGFRASWEVFDFNREFPQQWADGQWDFHNSRFGVNLFVPVDEYQKTIRSVKYAVLFIGLTFLAFFILIELFNKRRIHPIQYLLVGFALCVFYLLLISLSEHLSFDIAYAISSVTIILLTIVYTGSILHKPSLRSLMAVLLTGLYGFLYVMLRLEDYSLLMGSLGLFVILAAVMMGTRKVDWYSFGAKPKLNGSSGE